MDANKIRLTLDFTQEQLETVETFFNYNSWDFEETKVSDTNGVSSANCDMSIQTQDTHPHISGESQDD